MGNVTYKNDEFKAHKQSVSVRLNEILNPVVAAESDRTKSSLR